VKKVRQESDVVVSHQDEGALKRETEAGDIATAARRSVEEAWAEFGRRLYWFALSMVCSASDAEDVLQNVFLGLVRSIKSGSDVQNMRAYLYRAVRNEAWRLKRMRSFESGVDIDMLPLLVDAEQGRVDEALDVSQALAKLPLEQREVVVLKLFHDMTFDEIARMAGVSLNTAASRYRYGVDKMRRSVEARREG